MNKINKKKIIIFSIIILLGGLLFQPVLAEEVTSTPFEPEPIIIQGCTDSSADNYNSEATEDDDSCTYPVPEPVIIQGCTDSLANNYNSEATEDDNSCIYPEPESEPEPVIIQGCTDSSADNYNSEATEDNNSCTYPQPTPDSSAEATASEEATAGEAEPEPESQSQPSTSSDDGTDKDILDELKELINSGLQTQQNQINQIQQQNQSNDEPEEPVSEEPAFDSAIAPSKVTISVLMPNGTPPSFPVFVTFVGVGKKNFGGKIDANGQITVTMPQGRYYTELMVVNTQYIQGEDGPSFFLESDEERNLGVIKLIPKSEQNNVGQSLSDKTLESNLDNELGTGNKGLASVLSMIVKLLMQILEELRSLTSYIMSGNN